VTLRHEIGRDNTLDLISKMQVVREGSLFSLNYVTYYHGQNITLVGLNNQNSLVL